jgi:hypothetical protein
LLVLAAAVAEKMAAAVAVLGDTEQALVLLEETSALKAHLLQLQTTFIGWL